VAEAGAFLAFRTFCLLSGFLLLSGIHGEPFFQGLWFGVEGKGFFIEMAEAKAGKLREMGILMRRV